MYQPSLFLSHGAPDLVLKTGHPTYQFLQELPQTFPRPDAIVIFSAHWCTEHLMIAKNESYKTIYDFGGFDEQLYAMRYAAHGSPELAGMILDLVKKNDNTARHVNNAGLDHGAWIPLMLMYPDPFIPVVEVAIQPNNSPEYHYFLGKSLRELRQQNVLVIGSGSMTHNLYETTWNNDVSLPPRWVTDFSTWMKDRIEAGDKDSILRYRALAPYAEKNHPTDEHLLPLFIAMGAGGTVAKRIHTASTYGTVMMDAYQFN
jgi:4,5-DOPA dioxygenase extradiol